jgi:hypothetical protein
MRVRVYTTVRNKEDINSDKESGARTA